MRRAVKRAVALDEMRGLVSQVALYAGWAFGLGVDRGSSDHFARPLRRELPVRPRCQARTERAQLTPTAVPWARCRTQWLAWLQSHQTQRPWRRLAGMGEVFRLVRVPQETGTGHDACAAATMGT
jgi:hypothetical protein